MVLVEIGLELEVFPFFYYYADRPLIFHGLSSKVKLLERLRYAG